MSGQAGATETAVPALEIEGLVVEFAGARGPIRGADGVSYAVNKGEILAVVGETGSGKSVTALAALGLLSGGRITAGSVRIAGRDVLKLRPRERRRMLGRDVAIIFQDPIATLNPVMRVGDQILEALRSHDPRLPTTEAIDRAVALLESVGVPEPRLRIRQYPHQFSGGMCQRIVIAMAIANQPALLVADEPTTAVDVTIQAQLLQLLKTAQRELRSAVVLITHDLGVVAEIADKVAVMYAGRLVEFGSVFEIFARPTHPYTAGLMASLPRVDTDIDELAPIPGQPPDMSALPPGCPFVPRCSLSRGREICVSVRPALAASPGSTSHSACHFSEEVSGFHILEDVLP
jgi:oligopeptide/dipeptide ABC transporter ATP-binding protein